MEPELNNLIANIALLYGGRPPSMAGQTSPQPATMNTAPVPPPMPPEGPPGGLPGSLPGSQIPPDIMRLAQMPFPGRVSVSPLQQASIRFVPGYGYVQGGYDPQQRSAVLRGLAGPMIAPRGAFEAQQFPPGQRVPARQVSAVAAPSEAREEIDFGAVPDPPQRPPPATEDEALREILRLNPRMTRQDALGLVPKMLDYINTHRQKDYTLSRMQYDDNLKRLNALINIEAKSKAAAASEAYAKMLEQKVQRGQATPAEFEAALKALQQIRLSADQARKEERIAFEELQAARSILEQESSKWYKPFARPSKEAIDALNTAEARYNAARDAYNTLSGLRAEEQQRFMQLRQQTQPAAAPAPALQDSGPPAGFETQGYRFKGGNWRDKNNWEKIR